MYVLNTEYAVRDTVVLYLTYYYNGSEIRNNNFKTVTLSTWNELDLYICVCVYACERVCACMLMLVCMGRILKSFGLQSSIL